MIYSELSDVGKETVDAVLDRLLEERGRSQNSGKSQTNNGTIGGDMIQY